ncbi:MAG: peptide chain release factor 2 [Kiritimatiellae bacterium]|nr:peptide chain release factor 2 [Kiritimatiellia bacterium]
MFDVAALTEKVAALDAKAVEPGFWDSPDKARAVIGETNRYRAVLKPFEAVSTALEDAELLIELSEQEEDEAQRNQAVKDAATSLDGAEAGFERLEMQSLLSGELDGSNAYLTLHAGAGGTESCDWAEMLLRMYRHYCESNGFDVEILELSPGDEAGIKSATIQVSADFAYGYLKAERGVHRLVRISPFDSNKRRHTSFAAMDVVAEVADDIEVDITDEDLRVDTYRSSGAGGQHVNTTDSAVRITHLPTGIVVACQAERSQHKNRAKAMKILRARVYEWMLDQTRKDMEKFYGEKGEIAWGSQIRSYVLQPYTMVKDHRTGEETSNVSAVLDGAIQPFIEAYLKKQAAG